MAAQKPITIDLSNYKDKVGSRVPEGRYRVRVADAEQDRSNAGNDMINLWLDIVGGDEDGQTIVDRLVLTEKSLFRVVGFMQALGLQTPKKRLSVNIQQWIGRVLDIDVEDGDPYNGRVKSEVRGYSRVKQGAKPAEPVQDDETGGDYGTPDSSPAEASTGLGEFAPEGGTEASPQEVADFAARANALGTEKSAPVAAPDTVDLDSLDL